MTPKEKAEELCYKMCLELPPRNGYLYAKQCALLAVDEINKNNLKRNKICIKQLDRYEDRHYVYVDYTTNSKKH
jgi:hypothetical protein